MCLSCLWSQDLLQKKQLRERLVRVVKLISVGKRVKHFVEEVGQYFDLINRGGLTYPSNLLFNVTQYAYLMFNVCISSVKCTFLEVAQQKQTFLGVFEQFITRKKY